jgi:hypothetical protein
MGSKGQRSWEKQSRKQAFGDQRQSLESARSSPWLKPKVPRKKIEMGDEVFGADLGNPKFQPSRDLGAGAKSTALESTLWI